MGQILPDLFCDKGHVGMEQPASPENVPQHILGYIPGLLTVLSVQAGLNYFNIPITELAPDKLIEYPCSLTHIIAL